MKFLPAGLFCFLLSSIPAAFAITVTTADGGSGPESITAAPDGGLILGSFTTPKIYRAAKGETKAKLWIDASADGAVVFAGVLSDASTNTLWACEVGPRVAGSPSPSSVLSFDLTSGTPKIALKAAKRLQSVQRSPSGPITRAHVSDTPNGIIYRIRPSATEGELFIKHRALDGIDGLCFLDGVLYANNVTADTIWRIPIDANGKVGNPVNIWTDQPIRGPDGMRVAGGHIFLAENANGRASMLTITGDIAHVTVIQTGLKRPTAIDPAGDVLWVGDYANDNAMSIPLPH